MSYEELYGFEEQGDLREEDRYSYSLKISPHWEFMATFMDYKQHSTVVRMLVVKGIVHRREGGVEENTMTFSLFWCVLKKKAIKNNCQEIFLKEPTRNSAMWHIHIKYDDCGNRSY